MEQVVSMLIGLIIKKALDQVLAGFRSLIRWCIGRCPYRLYRCKYVTDLEFQARCLTVLKRAYDDLPQVGIVPAVEARGANKWHH